MPADQPARQHAIGGDADAKDAARRQDVVLDAARDERIFHLHVGDRMHGGRAPDGRRAHFRQADVAHIALLHHLADGADSILDRHRRVEARGAVDVDVVDPEALQRIGEEIAHGRRARIVARPSPRRVAQRAELDAEPVAVARHALQRLADQHFIVAHAVEVAGVDQRHAGVERGVDRRDALGAVGGAVHAGHAHAAEAERRDMRAGEAELAMLHDAS